MDFEVDRTVTGEGVLFDKEVSARKHAEQYDKEVVSIDGKWLAKNRVADRGPLPSEVGDVVVEHVGQRFSVWAVVKPVEQSPGADVVPECYWTSADAARAAGSLAPDSRVFWRRADGSWTVVLP